MSARSAIWRWSWRVVRRDWRQHALVIALVAAGLMAATVMITSVLRLTQADQRNIDARELANASFGVVLYDDTAGDPTDGERDLRADLTTALAGLAGTEVIGFGDTDPSGIRLTEADPAGSLTQPWYQLVDGAWPGPGEVTLSIAAFEYFDDLATPVAIGDTVTLAERAFTVVGRHRNDTDFADLAAVVAPGEAGPWFQARVVTTDEIALNDRLQPLVGGIDPTVDGGTAAPTYSWAPVTSQQTPGETTVFAYALGAMLCLAVAVLSSAGFTVLANRRSRQLGVLAGLGATPSHLGAAMLSTGAVVGLVGSVIGVGVGLAVSLALTPALEDLLGFRVGFDVPWRHVLPLVGLGVLTAVAGAWRPARRARSVSAAAAIADRPTRREGFVRSLVIGVALVTAGSIAMLIGAPKNDPLLVMLGVLLPGAGGLLLAPALTAILGRVAGRAPLPIRMAWRDIDRNRSRSSGAVAAAAMAIGIPFAVATFVGSIGHSWAPTLPDDTARVYTATEIPTDADALTAIVPGSRVVPITIVSDPAWDDTPDGGSIPWGVTTERRNGDIFAIETALATPELLTVLGIEPAGDDVDLIVAVDSRLDLPGDVVVQRHDQWGEGLPQALIVDRTIVPAGAEEMSDSALLVADHSFTDRERAQLRSATDSAINFTDDPPPFVAIRTIAIAAGALFAVAAIAVTVALIRTETARDQRILRSLGASPARARAVGAATAAGLATAASAIAVVVSLSVLAGIFRNPDEDFTFHMPWAELGVVFVVVPLLAGAAGWVLTSGRTDRSSGPAFG